MDIENQDRAGLAESRTELAEDRTLLANERTFAGWMRTGLSCVAIGLGFHALFARMDPDWVPKAIATAFLLVGIFVFHAATRRACRVTDRLDAHKVTAFGAMNLRAIAWTMSAATTLLIAAIWFLTIGW
jgi:putative membrane protein